MQTVKEKEDDDRKKKLNNLKVHVVDDGCLIALGSNLLDGRSLSTPYFIRYFYRYTCNNVHTVSVGFSTYLLPPFMVKLLVIYFEMCAKWEKHKTTTTATRSYMHYTYISLYARARAFIDSISLHILQYFSMFHMDFF